MEHSTHAATGGLHAAYRGRGQPPAGVHVPSTSRARGATSHVGHAADGGETRRPTRRMPAATTSTPVTPWAMFRDKFWLSPALDRAGRAAEPRHRDEVRLRAPDARGHRARAGRPRHDVFLYGGLVFLRGAAGELRGRQPGMMTLISLAIVVAFGHLVGGHPGPVRGRDWWELAT